MKSGRPDTNDQSIARIRVASANGLIVLAGKKPMKNNWRNSLSKAVNAPRTARDTGLVTSGGSAIVAPPRAAVSVLTKVLL